jgi:hypothetical protein
MLTDKKIIIFIISITNKHKMKRVQNKHRRSAKKHLIKNKSKSRSRKYKIGAGGDEGTPPPRYAHGLSKFPVYGYGTSAAPSTPKPKPAPPQKPK